ncbi:MAG: SCO family protein [Rhodothermales bacterium]
MRALDNIQRFIVGWKFPVLMIATLFFLVLFMGVILLIPDSSGTAGAFAEDFKIWCFGYDPATGEMEWGYVWMFLIQPFLLIGILLLIWGKPLKEVLSTAPSKIGRYVGLALGFVCCFGVSLVLLVDPGPQAVTDLSFPADRIRTSHVPASFTLTNQEGEAVSLEALQGRVVLVTAVYARCGYTCPMILAQTRRVIEALSPEERDALTVVAITLDPEHDTPDVLKKLTQGQKVEAPFFNALTGEPGYVNRVLDQYGFARSLDPETGIIDHTNLFILIDRKGRIAYRFSLGQRQEAWLLDALHVLIKEDLQA